MRTQFCTSTCARSTLARTSNVTISAYDLSLPEVDEKIGRSMKKLEKTARWPPGYSLLNAMWPALAARGT
jgi:hypothetical protein